MNMASGKHQQFPAVKVKVYFCREIPTCDLPSSLTVKSVDIGCNNISCHNTKKKDMYVSGMAICLHYGVCLMPKHDLCQHKMIIFIITLCFYCML